MSCQNVLLAQPGFKSAVFAAPPPNNNHLLASLPEAELGQWRSSLELVSICAGHRLRGIASVSPGDNGSYAYFPIDCLVSVVCATPSGGAAEVAVVGCEGMVGTGLFLAGSSYSSEAIAQCSGFAYRIKTSSLRKHFDRSPAVRELLLRHIQIMLVQSSQIALCNRHHTVDQQLCRWLLSAADRLRASTLAITQESIATTLGVRRAGITEAAGQLQRAGLIRYRRGKIELLDRPGLEQRACECYGVLKRELQCLSSTGVAPGAGNCVWLTSARTEMPAPAPDRRLPKAGGITLPNRRKIDLVEPLPPPDPGADNAVGA